MNIETAINTAIEYETRVRETFVEAMDEQVEPIGKRIYKLLADEEDGHVQFLRETLSSWKKTGRLSSEGLKTALPSSEAIQQGVAKLETALEKRGVDKEISLLKRAREVEMETSQFYRKMMTDLNEEGREFFSRFVEIEEGHLALVEAEIDALNRAGFWFDMSEFDLETS